MPSSYEEMACDACMRSHDFLRAYQLRTQPVMVRGEEGGGSVNVISDEQPQTKNDGPNEKKAEGSGEAGGGESDSQGGGEKITTVEGGRGRGVCELARRRSMGQEGVGAGFFAGGWRAQLCQCTACVVSSARVPKVNIPHTSLPPPPPPPPSPSMPPWVFPTCCRRRTVWRPMRGGARPSPPPTMQPWLPCPPYWTGRSRWKSFMVSVCVVCVWGGGGGTSWTSQAV